MEELKGAHKGKTPRVHGLEGLTLKKSILPKFIYISPPKYQPFGKDGMQSVSESQHDHFADIYKIILKCMREKTKGLNG